MLIPITLSAHELCDLLLRKGSIDSRIFNNATMIEGTKIHKYYQEKQGSTYIAEMKLMTTFAYEGFLLTLEGRADGVIKDRDGDVTIDEIKSTVDNIEDFHKENENWHLGQAMFYAFIYCIENNKKEIDINLTYISQIDKKKKYFYYHKTIDELHKFIFELLAEYFNFYNIIKENRVKRNLTTKKMSFIFSKYRKYQKEVMQFCAESIKQNKHIMFEAPTGIGKTLSSLFPCFRGFSEFDYDKIFYLTAKNSGKKVVEDTLKQFEASGAKFKAIILTAKETSCINEEYNCSPNKCLYAALYYEKALDVVKLLLKEDKCVYTYEDIKEVALKYKLCPFELSLDFSLYCDVIVGDYNYVYDPFSYLQRYIQDSCKNYVLLVDESHNLVSRGRDMYSCSFDMYDIKKAKLAMKQHNKKDINNILNKINKELKNIVKDNEDGGENIDLIIFPESLIKVISKFLTIYMKITKDNENIIEPELKSLYLKLSRFAKLLDFNAEYFSYYFHIEQEKYVSANLFCISPTEFLLERTLKFRSSMFFSATLTPLEYYKNLLFGNNEIESKIFLSPFKKENLNLMVAKNISLKYKDREESSEKIFHFIEKFISYKEGNYLLYVPSFQYMTLLQQYLYTNDLYNVIYQSRNMDIFQKELFLDKFYVKEKTNIFVVVLGGIFNESLDLKGELLIGVIVLGVGYPYISYENELIKQYYKNGYNYAYTYPGMNNVTQAVGRLIRDENDKGSVLLVDSRYSYRLYLDLFKDNWKQNKYVNSLNDIKRYMLSFYKKD